MADRRLHALRRSRLLPLAAIAGALAFVVPASAALIVRESKLTPPGGGEAGAQSGWAVAIDGNTAVVGAPSDDTVAGADAGSAFVYIRSGGTWGLQQELTASDGAAGDRFGWSVDASGDTLIVGARTASVGTETLAGTAYVFVRSGTTWTQQQKLVASDVKKAGDGFGFSVAVAGDLALVGAWGDNTLDGPDAGSAYIFRRAGTTWTEEQKLKASDGEPSAVFGAAVSLSGQTALIGAFADDGAAGPDQGAAYVFVYDGTRWSQQQKLTPSSAEGGAVAGYSVALDGDIAVLGAPLDDRPAGADAGSANVFVRSGSVWSEQQMLVPSDAAAGDEFGTGAGIDGGTIVVGAALDDTAAGPDAGSAYVFSSGSPWTQAAHLVASDGAGGDSLGNSARFSVDTALVGAPGDDLSGGADAGSAYAFRLTEEDVGAIAGKVKQTAAAGGAPIPGATVNCPGAGQAVTGANGRYSIANVPPDTYSCTASAAGYRSRTKSVTVVGGQTSLLTFKLAPA